MKAQAQETNPRPDKSVPVPKYHMENFSGETKEK
jgi:hypothetical protein